MPQWTLSGYNFTGNAQSHSCWQRYRFAVAKFLPRDAMHARYQPWACVRVCVCLRLSVTSRSSTKTAKRRITSTTPHDSPGTLVFWRHLLRIRRLRRCRVVRIWCQDSEQWRSEMSGRMEHSWLGPLGRYTRTHWPFHRPCTGSDRLLNPPSARYSTFPLETCSNHSLQQCKPGEFIDARNSSLKSFNLISSDVTAALTLFPGDAMLSSCVCLSVCPSVTSWYSIKRLEESSWFWRGGFLPRVKTKFFPDPITKSVCDVLRSLTLQWKPVATISVLKRVLPLK